MKAVYSIAILLLVAIAGSAQTPHWQWGRSSLGVNTVSQACCTDAHGNVYAAGFFYGTVSFGADTITDTDGPYQDVFLVKYDALGNVKWARKSNGYADAYGLTADDYGNIYLVGDFYSDSISFGSHTLTDTISGSSNIYLAKYDSSGNAIWAKNLGVNANDFASGVSTDHSGNIYVTGYFTGDSLALDNIVLHQSGAYNVFLAKFNSFGTTVWAHSEGSSGIDGPNAICTDSLGNVFITGYFTSLNMTFGAVTLSSPYMNNLFVTKYDSSGDVRWAKYFGGNNGNAVTGISADASGNVYVTGYYLDTILIGNHTLVSAGPQNIFIAGFDSSGTVSWAESAGGTYVDQANAISADASGNCYITGYFQSDTAVFAGDTLINQAGNPITFVAKYSPAGQAQWGIAVTGGTTYNQAAGISYSAGGIYVAGSYNGQTLILGNDTLFSPSSQGSFFARIGMSLPAGITPMNNTTDRIIVYPNPSSGSFHFNGVASDYTIEVYDLVGQNIFTAVVDRDDYSIALGEKRAGVYFYQVSAENKVIQNGKIIVK